MRGIICVSLTVVCFWSCKKTKLDGDLSVFVGTWEWRYCVKTIDLCEPFPYDSLITSTPASKGYTYTLIFEEKGKLIVKKDGKRKSKDRLVFFSKEDQGTETMYIFKLNNKEKVRFAILNHRPETMKTLEYPEGIVDERVEGCENTHSVFEKVN